MPYRLKKIGKEYCVVKQAGGKPVPGGCHKTRPQALAHLRALYANVKDAK